LKKTALPLKKEKAVGRVPKMVTVQKDKVSFQRER